MRQVLFDGEAFYRHGRSGISRYLSELIAAYRREPALGVSPVTPYRWVANEHVAETVDGQRRVLLPPSWRAPVLSRVNRRSRSPAELTHHSLYEPGALTAWPATRHICTVYDFSIEHRPSDFPNSHLAQQHKALFLDRCDALLCISQTTHDDLRRFHPSLDKPVFVTPLGVSSAFFDVPERPIRGVPERYLLHVGSRHAHKNVDLLFRAFAELDDQNLHLVLCGRGEPSEADRLQELGIAHRTRVLRATDAQLPSLYHHAQAFVFPSRYEGFGLPVVEAMAARCPTVISDAPALVEVAGGVCPVVDGDDVDGLVHLLQQLLGDPRQQNRLRELGVARARDFTWRRTAVTTAAAYDQTVLT